MGEYTDSIRGFIKSAEAATEAEWSVTIVNRTGAETVQSLVEEVFQPLSVTVSETEVPAVHDDLLLLSKGGTIVETAPLEPLKETVLLVNSDTYRTGATSIHEFDPCDVIVELSNTAFTLRGYPESNTEKLLLIVMARYIEQRALVRGEGTLRTAFQHLSRIDDELGTKQVYERLSDATVDVHVYGVADWDLPPTLDVTTHSGRSDELRRTWALVYRSPTDDECISMLAYETGPNEWEGFWTFDAEEVRAIDSYVARRLVDP